VIYKWWWSPGLPNYRNGNERTLSLQNMEVNLKGYRQSSRMNFWLVFIPRLHRNRINPHIRSTLSRNKQSMKSLKFLKNNQLFSREKWANPKRSCWLTQRIWKSLQVHKRAEINLTKILRGTAHHV
jgi:hypothetical protein